MSNLLTADEIANMRAEVGNVALPDVCNILTLTQTADGQGGFTDTWGTTTIGVACRLNKITVRELVSGAALQPFSRWILTLPYDTAITEQNRVEVGTISYNVIGLDNRKSWNLCIRVELEKAE